MKQYSLAIFLLFSITCGSFAQTKNDILLQKQQEIKEREQRKTQDKKNAAVQVNNAINPISFGGIKPVIEMGGKEYDFIKAEGKLAHYEVIQKAGKIVSVKKTDYTKLS